MSESSEENTSAALREELGRIDGKIEEIEASLAELRAQRAHVAAEIDEFESKDKTYLITVDDVKHEVHQRTMTGAEIKALAGKDASYQLFEERPGDDQQIANDESVAIRDGLVFYTVPPATFGVRPA